MTTRFTRLSMPGMIGNVEIKNRLCNSPAIPNYSRRDGSLTQREIDYYLEKAKGGLGLVFMSATSINDHTAKEFWNQPALYSDEFIPRYRELTDGIHEYGAKCCVQLLHPGRVTHPMFTGGRSAEAPTAVPDPLFGKFPGYEIVEMTTERIREVIREYADTAKRCKEAGFDMVEIHSAHGYLPLQFLTRYYGERQIKDEYAGTYLENKCNFTVDVLRAIQKECGEDFSVGMRLSVDELVEGGLTIDDSVTVVKTLEEEGLSYISVSLATTYPGAVVHMIIPSFYSPPLYLEPLASKIKEAVNIPVMQVGRVSSPEMAEGLLERGSCDFVQVNRATFADPHFVNKALSGKEEDIRHCAYCNAGCAARVMAYLDICCTMNPELGREREFAEKLEQTAPVPKKVVVIGGGPGGMSCARYAKLKGHEVVLLEKEEELGGLNRYSQKGERREEFEEVTRYYSREIKRLGVDIRLGQEGTVDMVESFNPEVVVVATGSQPNIPIIKGIRKPNGLLADNVVISLEVLGDEKQIGDRVVIVGGNHIGIQVAMYLEELGKKVTIVEALQDLNQDIDEYYTWNYLQSRLENSDIEIIKGMYVKEINSEGVLCEPSGILAPCLNVGVEVTIDAEKIISCDNVVVGTGREAEGSLFRALQGKVPELYAIGDCVKPRWTYNATGEGARVAVNL